MFGLAKIVLFAATASALVVPRDLKSVLASLATIDADNKNLNDTITKWDGSLLGALSIQTAENKLDGDVKSATTAAGKEKVFTSADTQSVIDYLNVTLAPGADAALKNIITRKADVTKNGITSTVHDGLATLKTDIDALGAALLKIASTDKQTDAKAQLTKIDTSLQAAIDAYAK